MTPPIPNLVLHTGGPAEPLAVELARLQRELATAQAERDLHAQRADALTRELMASETAAADVEALRAALTAALEQVEHYDDVREQLDRVERELAATHATFSWRVTHAMRFVRRGFRGRSA